MTLSNDIKWNKIKVIEKQLGNNYSYYKYSYQLFNNCEETEAERLANLDTWILANQIYDIATEGWEDENSNFYYHHWCRFPITSNKVIELANQFAKRNYFDPKLVRYQID